MMYRFIFILIIILFGTIECIKNDHLFIRKTDPSVYNRWLPPDNYPITVNISVILFGVAQIYELNNEFHLDLLLRTSWMDNRIGISNSTETFTTDSNNQTIIIQGGVWHLNRIWLPPIYIVNTKQPNIFNDPNEHPVLVQIRQTNGLILLSKRLTIYGHHQLDFRLYPFDIQQIRFEIETNELNIHDLQLQWSSSIYFNENFDWNGFELIRYRLIETNTTYIHTGTYSRLIAIFYIRRKFTQSLLDVFIPIALFVIVSWGSFWIEITAAPARITLGVTIMLTMVTMARSAREKLPEISYIHSLDIWILSCIIFVFASIVEYVSVNYIYHMKKRFLAKKRKHFTNLNDNDNGSDDNTYDDHKSSTTLSSANVSIVNFKHHKANNNNNNNNNIKNTLKKRKIWRRISIDNGEEYAYEIDRRSRKLFPICFIIFNLIYWITLYTLSKFEQISID
ncbi:glycine receptor subunit alpha-2-like [Dermatophagoides pteronyssinus]|uniref:glycine receptor subunit alpha-2-like n=1 Tax=Dermatophagoides pteronyssinus TaxID=6956 RepID=UPI003F661D8B